MESFLFNCFVNFLYKFSITNSFSLGTESRNSTPPFFWEFVVVNSPACVFN